jgi:phytoene/squalene synthetase
MTARSAALAKSITWAASKQSYLTALLMVDRGLIDDAFRAYGYFRWIDDVVDIDSRNRLDRTSFMTRQKEIIQALYRGDRPADLTPEEEMVADMICRHEAKDAGVHSYIKKMLGVIDFDAHRRGKLVGAEKLRWYSDALGASVVDAIQFFIGGGQSYPKTEDRYAAGIAAHIAHILRDMRADIADGFVNIPREYLEQHGLDPEDVEHSAFRSWVREQVDTSRKLFRLGRRYLDKLDSLRVKIVGFWYCARFDGVLDAIEQDGYVLRKDYGSRHGIANWMKMASVAISTTVRHNRA